MLISPHRRQPPATIMSASSSDEEVGPSTCLRNFTSLPCFNVTWGRREHLCCVKDFDLDHCNGGYYLTSSSSPSSERRRSPPDGDGIESVRKKLMLDLRTQVDRMKASIFKRSRNNNGENRPWNLRTRRAVCRSPNFNGGGDRKGNFPAEFISPPRRGGVGGRSEVEVSRAKPRAKFSVLLSKQEIEEDFLMISGNRPARRPKKRAKYVQKQIDALFPGSLLSEVTPEMYKVDETAKR